MKGSRRLWTVVAVSAAAAINVFASANGSRGGPTVAATAQGTPPRGGVAEGQRIFRFDTFGDEKVWTDTLRLHEVVEKSVDPTTALKVGLKVDAAAQGGSTRRRGNRR